MPYKILFAVFVSLFAFGVASAQTEPRAAVNSVVFTPGPSTVVRMFQEIWRAENQGKNTTFAIANNDDELQSFANISESQWKFLKEKLHDAGESLDEEGRGVMESLNRWQELSEEEIAQHNDTFGTLLEKLFDTTDSIIAETLTPPQLQLIREYQLVVPGTVAEMLAETGLNIPEILVNFGAYEALDLSEEQKEALAKLQEESQKEMQPIWNDVKALAEYAYEKAQNAKSAEELDIQEIITKAKGILDKAAPLAKKTREQIEESLTPEQKERLAQIREEVPLRLAKIKEELEKKKAEAAKDESWKDAWKPGDPIPEHLKAPEPKRRFPFGL